MRARYIHALAPTSLTRALIALAAAMLWCTPSANAAWVQVGGSLNVSSTVTSQNPAYEGDGPQIGLRGTTPHIAFLHRDPTSTMYRLYAKRWTGSSWEQLNSTSPQSGYLNYKSTEWANNHTVASSTGSFAVAWDEADGTYSTITIRVREWTGTAWSAITTPSNGTYEGRVPALAFNGSAVLNAAWEEKNSLGWKQIRVKKLVSGAWSYHGGAGSESANVNTGAHAYTPDLAFNGTTAYVTYVQGTTIYARYAAAGATSWTSLASSVATGSTPKIRLISGVPHVVYLSSGGVYHRSYASGVWSAATKVSGAGTAKLPELYLDGTVLRVAWEEGGVAYHRSLSGSTWSATSPGLTGGEPTVIGLSGVPWLARWQNNASSIPQTYVTRWNNPPAAPTVVNDGPTVGTDIAWARTTSIQGTWPAVADASTYTYCFTTTINDCALTGRLSTGTVSTTSVTTPTAAVQYTLYYLCVRSNDADGESSAYRCSNGQRADVTTPTNPTTRNDGATAGTDIDYTNSTTSLSGTWSVASDGTGSGIANYDYCITTTTAQGLAACTPIHSASLGTVTTASMTDSTLGVTCDCSGRSGELEVQRAAFGCRAERGDHGVIAFAGGGDVAA